MLAKYQVYVYELNMMEKIFLKAHRQTAFCQASPRNCSLDLDYSKTVAG